MFIGSSLLPDYFQHKIELFVALAPIVRMDKIQSSMMVQVSKIPTSILEGTIQTLHVWDLLPRTWASKEYGKFCHQFQSLCQAIAQAEDFDPAVDNAERLEDDQSHTPSGTGWRCLLHYAQVINSGEFKRYDYGEQKNMVTYGQPTPPMYDLSEITIPVAIYHGDVDDLADPWDVAWLINKEESKLNTVVYSHMYHLGHGSFLLAKDMSWFTLDLLSVISKY